MEAVVTVKMSPSELDVITAALLHYRSGEIDRGDDAEVAPAERRDAKQNAVKATDILSKLR